MVQHKMERVPVLSWPTSILLEACTQVALNVDFRRARAQSARAGFWVALVKRPSPLPATGPVPLSGSRGLGCDSAAASVLF